MKWNCSLEVALEGKSIDEVREQLLSYIVQQPGGLGQQLKLMPEHLLSTTREAVGESGKTAKGFQASRDLLPLPFLFTSVWATTFQNRANIQLCRLSTMLAH